MASRFKASDFTPTKYETAADKVKFAETFVRFVEGGFEDKAFSKVFYLKLSHCFGHIAHTHREGFYAAWFTTTKDRLCFLENCVQWRPCGQPEFTFCDVESRLAAWVASERWCEKLSEQLAAETEKAERAELARLQAKYPAVRP